MKVNNNENTPNFTAFVMQKSSQKRFMRALRDECNTRDLIEIRNTMESQIKNQKTIRLIDFGYMFGQPVNGHLSGTVNGKEYSNGFIMDFFGHSIPKLIKKLARKADDAVLKDEKRKASTLLEECLLHTKAQNRRQEQDMATKLDIKNALKLRKQGKVTKEEQNHYLLGEIYKLIQG